MSLHGYRTSLELPNATSFYLGDVDRLDHLLASKHLLILLFANVGLSKFSSHLFQFLMLLYLNVVKLLHIFTHSSIKHSKNSLAEGDTKLTLGASGGDRKIGLC